MSLVSSADETSPRQSEGSDLDGIIRTRATRTLYQPIVELDSARTIGWEALTRGPAGSPLEFPDALFTEATRLGRTADLDHCCQAAAITGAIAAGLGRDQDLFVNIESEVAGVAVPTFLARARAEAEALLRGTVEVTERALTTAPAELVAMVDMYRSRGWGIAIDDVGVDARSVALMPLLRPDVIKLDMSFVQRPMTRERARVLHAVVAEAERSGAAVLAEGIETAEHAEIAKTIGATLGQGWHFGRPGVLLPGSGPIGTPRVTDTLDLGLDTPFEHLRDQRPTRAGTKARLLQMSLALEEQALLQGDSAVLMATFQEASFFSASTGARYARLARSLALVAALAHDLDPEPAPSVRGSALDSEDALRGEWDVVVLGPHFAGAFVARDLGDGGADSSRRFEYIVTHDRDLVTAAARRLMSRVVPVPA